ncbi:MAG TPA: sugar ABC transporter ATP-binding protein [Conexibacter sp.]|nr:sugar ABC transporter ATP-binding protein [Conexibacter sp.]
MTQSRVADRPSRAERAGRPPASPPLLRVRGVGKRFPGVVALDAVDFELAAGEVHCLLGENGAGKSTLVKILAGAQRADEGTIELAGEEVSFASPQEAQRHGLAFIFQELSVVPSLSVADNIVLGNEVVRGGLLQRREAHAEARALMESIGFPGIDPGRPVRSLSIAEQQGVMIARALRLDSRVIVMDEATSALTGEEVARLFALIRRLKARGRAIVFVSHRLQELAEIGDRVTVFKDGRHVDTVPASTPPQELVRLMVGRNVQGYPDGGRAAGEVVLRARGLRTALLDGVDLDVRAGEVLGIAGLVGSGRTELLRALFGADRLDGGTLELDGRPLRLRRPSDAIDAGLALVPEDRRGQGIVALRSVGENLLTIWETHKRLRPKGERSRALAQRLVTQLSVKTPSLEQRISLLSGGNQQKVVIGKWLAVGPRVLLLDEPTKGIDVGAKMELFRIVDGLARAGMAVVMVSSELPEVLGMADRICVMKDGRIAREFLPGVSEEEIVAVAMSEEEEAK